MGEYKKIQIRITSELAEKLRIAIIKRKTSMNKFIVDAIKEKIERERDIL